MYVIHKAHLIFRIDPTTPYTSLIDRVGNPELCSVWVLCRYVIHISECYHCRGWKAHSSVWHAKIVMEFCRWLECLELVDSFIQLCQTAGLRQRKCWKHSNSTVSTALSFEHHIILLITQFWMHLRMLHEFMLWIMASFMVHNGRALYISSQSVKGGHPTFELQVIYCYQFYSMLFILLVVLPYEC